MKIRFLAAVVLSLLTSVSVYAQQFFDVTRYGAKKDSSAKATAAIAKAIAAASAAGGGTVYFPAGKYLTGPIHLKSNITIFIDAGAELSFSDDFDDYLPMVPSRWEGTEVVNFSPLFYAYKVENITIRGRGTINGNGRKWWLKHFEVGDRKTAATRPLDKWQKEFVKNNPDILMPDHRSSLDNKFLRPPFIQPMYCRNVLIEGITIRNSPFWTINPQYCENVTITGVTINNPPSPNTDGINPESCKYVHISNCHISVGDDCITIKSGKDRSGRKMNAPAEGYTITNCTMLSGHGGVVIGSEMSGGVRNIVISNCIFDGTDRGIRIKSARGRGGVVEGIRVDNIIMKNIRQQAFVLDLQYTRTQPAPVSETTPAFRDIHLSNITAQTKQAGYINGLEEMPIDDITFNDIQIEAETGFTIRNATNIEFHNVRITTEKGSSIIAENVDGLELDKVRTRKPVPGVELFSLKNVRNVVTAAAPMQSPVPNDLTLWYTAPAEKWTEALPIGNGRLGAMIYGGVEKDRLQFNEETLWTAGPRDYNRKGAYRYLPEIRRLLFEGKREEAEQLAEKEFMGLKSDEGNREQWFKKVRKLPSGNKNPASPRYNDKDWAEMELPVPEGWERAGFEGLDGAVWFRTHFELPAGWEGKNLVLDLGRIRDQDFTYVNGQLAGSTEGMGRGRVYKLPEDLLKKGQNLIAVQVLNYYDKGGLVGYKDAKRLMKLYPEGDPASYIPLNKNWKFKVQDDSPPAVPRYQADYQPFGDLELDFKISGEVENYRRDLDLSNALSHVYFTAGGVNYTREYFASAPDQAIVVQLTADKPGSISFRAALNSPHKQSTVTRLDDQTIALSLQVKNGALRGESYLRAVCKKGTLSVAGNEIVIDQADEVTLYLTAATNFKNYRDVSGDPVQLCRKALQQLQPKSYEAVKTAHIAEYQPYFNTFSLKLGSNRNNKLPTNVRLENFTKDQDPAFVALYVQYGRYLLISSSRPGTHPANLQGIWNDLLTPPWGSKYTTNINLEMNYWPAELLNLSPMHEPLFDMIDDLSVAGTETAREYYNAPGWVLHHNTDEWRGTAPINASNHGIWVTGGAWLSKDLWEHFLFTHDTFFLRERAYPIMKRAAEFFVSFLIPDPVTGYLISTPSNSPEQGGLVAGPTMDHQIIRDLFSNCMQAGALLGIDNAFRDTLQQKYSRIAPNKIGKYGQLQEWMQDVDDPNNKHRHVSHLWGVYPGHEINWEHTPELMRAARQSLIYRGDAGTGWSLAWKINLWSRFKEGDHAYKLVTMLLTPAGRSGGGSYDNLFDAHPPFQIDGNFGGAAGIAEMLIQSQNGLIDLMPALPSAFIRGEVKGLCARGGFVVNMKWDDRKIQVLELYSRAGQPCRLRYGNKTIELATEKGKTYRFDGNLATTDKSIK